MLLLLLVMVVVVVGRRGGGYTGPWPRAHTRKGLTVAGQNAGQALVEAAVTDHASLLDVREVVGSLDVSPPGGRRQREGG